MSAVATDMRKLILLICAAVSAMLVKAEVFTFADASAVNQTKGGITLKLALGSGSSEPTYKTNYYTGEGEMRLYAGNTITISGTQVQKVYLRFTKQGEKAYADLSVNTGNLSSGGESESNTDVRTDSWTGNATSVVFTLGSTGQRIITTVYVNEEPGGGDDDDDDDDDDDTLALDTTWVYEQPTLVYSPDSVGSNLENYSFICNNVLINCTLGAISGSYFGCNAESSITFTTTRKMQRIVVDGYIKKDFSATQSSGELWYADADEAAVEDEQVLTVDDIDNTVLTLNCQKQLRIYTLYVSFYDDDQDALEDVRALRHDGVVRNMLGQEVDEYYQGIVIINGECRIQ